MVKGDVPSPPVGLGAEMSRGVVTGLAVWGIEGEVGKVWRSREARASPPLELPSRIMTVLTNPMTPDGRFRLTPLRLSMETPGGWSTGPDGGRMSVGGRVTT